MLAVKQVMAVVLMSGHMNLSNGFRRYPKNILVRIEFLIERAYIDVVDV